MRANAKFVLGVCRTAAHVEAKSAAEIVKLFDKFTGDFFIDEPREEVVHMVRAIRETVRAISSRS